MRARLVAGPAAAVLLVLANVVAAWIAAGGDSSSALCGGSWEETVGPFAVLAVIVAGATAADTAREVRTPRWGAALAGLGAAGAAAAIVACAWFFAALSACLVF